MDEAAEQLGYWKRRQRGQPVPRSERNSEILSQLARGDSYVVIGKRHGISRQRVAQIASLATAKAQDETREPGNGGNLATVTRHKRTLRLVAV